MPVGFFRKAGTQRVIFDGQSLNYVPFQAGDPYNSGDDFTRRTNEQSYPSRLMSGRSISWCNVAKSGFGWGFLAQDETSRLHDIFSTTSESEFFLILVGGQSDLIGYAESGPFGPATGAKTYERMWKYADRARAAATNAGKTIVIIGCSIPPGDGVTYYLGSKETERQAANTLILANADAKFDDVVDFGTVDLIDEIHPSATGALAMAADVDAVLTPLL